MTTIKARATAEEARNCAEHSKNQWRQFMKITRKEAEQLLERPAVSTWVDISDKDQCHVLTAVNLQLQEKDIPEVTLEILNWRMPKAMWEFRKSNKTTSQAESHSREDWRPIAESFVKKAPTLVDWDSNVIDQQRATQLGWEKSLSLQPIVPTLALDGLVKVRPDQLLMKGSQAQVLSKFYLSSICAGRTILKDNAYAQEVLQIAQAHPVTKWAIVTLTASYYKEFLDDPEDSKAIKTIENSALQKTRSLLEQNTRTSCSSDAANMLLIQHAILNPCLHTIHWTNYLYQLQHSDNQQTNLIMARHAVWLMCILPLYDKYQFQTFDYSWIGHGEEDCLTRVNGILGTSRRMLYLQHKITIAAKISHSQNPNGLFEQVVGTHQWVSKEEKAWAAKIALDTAETYRLATELYFMVRLGKRTPSNLTVKSISALLASKLCELPTSGEGYSSIHPAWCFVIACACTEDLQEYEKLTSLLQHIGYANKSNVLDVLKLITWISEWKNGRKLAENWWEDMTDYLDSKMNGRFICLS